MLEKKTLGKDGPLVGRLGYGAMVLEGYYGGSEDDAAIRTLCHAIDCGMMIDSAAAPAPEIEAHLRECADCRRYRNALLHQDAALDGLGQALDDARQCQPGDRRCAAAGLRRARRAR